MKHNIICHDKKHIEISAEQKDKIIELLNTGIKGVEVNGEFIFFSSIARIEKGREEIKSFKNLPESNEVPIKGLKDLKEKMKMFKKLK